MDIISFLLLLVIAAISGAIGQRIAGYSLGGCLVSTVVGFIGALIGRWLADKMDLVFILPVRLNGETFPVIWAILGAAIFTVVIGFLTWGRKRL